jgi:inhibitor of cysteine peptidase
MDVRLNERDEGTTVDVVDGDTIVVRLEENPTTGFRWAIDAITGACVSPAGDDFEPAEGSNLGGGGRRTLTFTARQPGSSRIELKRWRDWEGDASIVQRFGVTVRVSAGDDREMSG